MNPIAKAVELLGGPTKTASILGVTTQAVCFWRDGKRKFPHEYGAAIESATKGVVTRKDLWPDDWAEIWPELVDAA